MDADDRATRADLPGPVPETPTPSARTVPAPRPSAQRPTPATPKQRPDPRPMRLVLGAGTIAAVSIMAAGLVRFPAPAADAIAADVATVETLATARPEVIVQHRTVYVQLKRGQHAPRGAKVIAGAVPTPRVVVTRIAARPATPRRAVVKTRQSGR